MKDRICAFPRTFAELDSAKTSRLRVPLDPPTKATEPTILECTDSSLTETLSPGRGKGEGPRESNLAFVLHVVKIQAIQGWAPIELVCLLSV